MRQAQDNLETWQDVFEPDEQRHRWRRITHRERNLKNLKKNVISEPDEQRHRWRKIANGERNKKI